MNLLSDKSQMSSSTSSESDSLCLSWLVFPLKIVVVSDLPSTASSTLIIDLSKEIISLMQVSFTPLFKAGGLGSLHEARALPY